MHRNLDHLLWKFLKENSLLEKKIILAVSGGLDSVALLHSFAKVFNKSQLIVCYVHHGSQGTSASYRDQAQEFVARLAHSENLEFVSLNFDQDLSKIKKNGDKDRYSEKVPSEVFQSEEVLREGRYQLLRNLLVERSFDLLALGQHADDLLETRLLRLIRGTGPQGLESMRGVSGDLCRPFLEISKNDLQSYLSEEGVKYLEDPSNVNESYLRNWLRQNWLPQLEQRQPGAVASFARSLQLIVNSLDQEQFVPEEYVNLQGISRSYYLTLDSGAQLRTLARYLFLLGIRDFSHSQLEEIKKRLANSQKVITFKVAGLFWDINAQQIRVRT